jgi:hypothetical protein
VKPRKFRLKGHRHRGVDLKAEEVSCDVPLATQRCEERANQSHPDGSFFLLLCGGVLDLEGLNAVIFTLPAVYSSKRDFDLRKASNSGQSV